MKCLKFIMGSLCAGLMLPACLPLQRFAQEPTDVSAAIEDYASGNPNDYVSFAAAVVDADEIPYSGEFGYIDRENGVLANVLSAAAVIELELVRFWGI